MNPKREIMFSEQNLLRFFLVKSAINPRIVTVKGIKDSRKTIVKSITVVESCPIMTKKVKVTMEAVAAITQKLFVGPILTAKVVFCPCWSFCMSGASRLRLRKNPYIINGIESKTKSKSS